MWLTHSELLKKQHSGCVPVELAVSVMAEWNSIIPAVLCVAWCSYASGTKIDFPRFSFQPCSVLLLKLKYYCDWKSFSQFDLPLVQQNLKRQNKPSHSSLDCPAALLHTEIGKVTLMNEIPTVNHWLAGLFTHSLKGSPFKFDQYQPKCSQRVTQWSGY